MNFTATEEQAKQIFCNAVNASVAVRMGFLHGEEKQYDPSEMPMEVIGMEADYFHGRMVKLSIMRVGPEAWIIARPDYLPNIAYQSWAGKYPSLEELVNSVL